MSGFLKPVPLAHSHFVADFDCGVDSLNQWLSKRALANERSGYSRTFVTCGTDEDTKVFGFYCLSAGAIARDNFPKSEVRHSPEPIPVILLGRLGVDKSAQVKGVGVSLLKDAIQRTKVVRSSIGAKVLLIHAINKSASEFYTKFGFRALPFDDSILYLREI